LRTFSLLFQLQEGKSFVFVFTLPRYHLLRRLFLLEDLGDLLVLQGTTKSTRRKSQEVCFCFLETVYLQPAENRFAFYIVRYHAKLLVYSKLKEVSLMPNFFEFSSKFRIPYTYNPLRTASPLISLDTTGITQNYSKLKKISQEPNFFEFPSKFRP